MVKSMTGFGKGQASAAGRKITVEVRTLNGKQLDMSVRIPSRYRAFEYEVRSRAARALERGKADIIVGWTAEGDTTGASIDEALFSSYFDRLRTLCRDKGLSMDEAVLDAALVSAVLRLPDVVGAADTEADEPESEVLFAALDEALARLDAFRRQEGEVLIADLLDRVDRIESYKKELEPYEKVRTEMIRNRIRENIVSLGISVDANRLEQEMIFYIEKLDITEEKVRLSNHCRYFREVAASEEAVGRKLGFIAQEMGREINTLGAKANDSRIQQWVVRMKDELEKIKEQVLNLL